MTKIADFPFLRLEIDKKQKVVSPETPDGIPTWIDDNGLMKPIHWEAWIQPRSSLFEGGILDVASPLAFDTDRVTLFFEEGELVLRVWDASGDHRATELVEKAEVRYAFAEEGDLAVDVWSHVAIEVRGTRPDQLDLLVDGRHVGRRPGLTYLAQNLGGTETTIVVESTEGFPDPCVLRIGDELWQRKQGKMAEPKLPRTRSSLSE